jgi:hypothetical protein
MNLVSYRLYEGERFIFSTKFYLGDIVELINYPFANEENRTLIGHRFTIIKFEEQYWAMVGKVVVMYLDRHREPFYVPCGCVTLYKRPLMNWVRYFFAK